MLGGSNPRFGCKVCPKKRGKLQSRNRYREESRQSAAEDEKGGCHWMKPSLVWSEVSMPLTAVHERFGH